MRNTTVIGRIAALAALVIAIVAVAIILTSGGSTYQVRAIFEDSSQLVSGDQVEVSGNSIGSVSKIALTPNGLAELTLTINDPLYRPLRQGTTAIIRLASQSGIANRYVDLDLGSGNAAPISNNGLLQASNTTSTVDLDELFNSLNSPTRQGLRDVFQGSASQYAGRGQQANLAWQYLNPAIATASVLFHELNRDTAKFTKFVVTSSNLVSDLAQRQADLSGLVSNASQVFTALANQQTALGSSLQQLPGFMRLSNTTFVNVRNALPDITQLVNASRPVAPKLQALLTQLQPLAVDAVPTIRDLANIISRPGPNNDLIELNQLAVPLAQVTVGKVQANGKLRPGAFPVTQEALKQSVPELAVGRPYAVDLTAWFEGYSHPATADANGGMSRVAGTVGVGTIGDNGVFSLLGTPLNNLLTNPLFGPGRNGLANQLITTGQGDRCPGSMERGPGGAGTSAAFYPESGFPCDPTQVPTGK